MPDTDDPNEGLPPTGGIHGPLTPEQAAELGVPDEGLPPWCGYRAAVEADRAAGDLDEEPDEDDAMRWTPPEDEDDLDDWLACHGPDDAAAPEAPADFSRTIVHS